MEKRCVEITRNCGPKKTKIYFLLNMLPYNINFYSKRDNYGKRLLSWLDLPTNSENER